VSDNQLPENLRQPGRLSELDIDVSTVEDMILRRAAVLDRTTVNKIATDLGLHPSIIAEVFTSLRERKYFDVTNLEGMANYHFSLTDVGRERARTSQDRSTWVGAAPVSLERYTEVVKWLRTDVEVSDEIVRSKFTDLVLNEKIVDEIGAAFAGQRSMLLWGPAGTGKTSIAERLIRLYDDWVLVPHAIDVDGAIITVFDPSVHKRVTSTIEELDPRWVICERPLVVAGGELELSMLQLQRDPVSKIYIAPLQLKANNGILLIDDFGRQLIDPSALLNRWIIPLERRIDYLTLDAGTKFQVPFEVLVVFSTNLNPNQLGDDAFFRRIQNKIYVGAATVEEFDEILTRVASAFEVELPPGAHQGVRDKLEMVGKKGLHSCYPVDLVRLVRNVCDYKKLPRVMNDEMISRAADLYFTNGGETGGGVFTQKQ
jgi:Magnesium chelatase, subunit ChlI